MLAAMKAAVAAYKGTSAEISNTTEGTKDSLQKAKEKAYKPAADSYNDVMREYYAEKKDKFDAKAQNREWVETMEEIGIIEGEIDVFFSRLGDWFKKLGNWVLVAGSFLGNIATGGELKGMIEERKGLAKKSKLDSAMERTELYDSQAAFNAFKEIIEDVAQEEKKLADLKYKFQHATLERERRGYLNAATAQKALVDAMREAQKTLTELTHDRIKEEQGKKAREEVERYKEEHAANRRENFKLQDEAALKGKDQDAIAATQMMHSADELVRVYEELTSKIQKHIALTDEEIELYKDLEKPYEAIMKLREEEAKDFQKSVQAQKTLDDGLVQMVADWDKRDKQADELRRHATESDAYNSTYDAMQSLQSKLDETDMSDEEKKGILAKEMAKLLEEARVQAVRSTEETISANGLKSLKDFKYTDFSVDEKMLSVQEDIQRAATDANQILNHIEAKLPSPVVAQ